MGASFASPGIGGVVSPVDSVCFMDTPSKSPAAAAAAAASASLPLTDDEQTGHTVVDLIERLPMDGRETHRPRLSSPTWVALVTCTMNGHIHHIVCTAVLRVYAGLHRRGH